MKFILDKFKLILTIVALLVVAYFLQDFLSRFLLPIVICAFVVIAYFFLVRTRKHGSIFEGLFFTGLITLVVGGFLVGVGIKPYIDRQYGLEAQHQYVDCKGGFRYRNLLPVSCVVKGNPQAEQETNLILDTVAYLCLTLVVVGGLGMAIKARKKN